MLNQGIGNGEYHQRYYSSRDWRVYNPILSQVVLFSQPGKVLDVGAGVGLLGEAALEWGFSYEGIEGSSEAIEIAHKRFPRLHLKQHLLSDTFPFSDETFQTVIINQVIEHLEPAVAENTISESYRVLQPNGVLLINSPSKFNSYERKADSTHINMYSPKELRKLLISKGFTRIHPRDAALYILGDSFLGKGIVYVLFKLTKWEFLSATANCIAYKPG